MNERSFIPSTSMTLETQDKRHKILKATLAILARRGFHGFSMKQLAQAAGVATGTVYLYFQDKDQLIEVLHEDLIQRIAVEFFRDHDPRAPPSVQFALFCRNYWRFCMNDPDAVLSKAQFDQLPPEVLVNQRRDARRIFAPLIELFDHCRHAGICKDLPDEVLVSLGIEPLLDLAGKVHRGIETVSPTQFETIVDACWDAIGQRRAPQP